MALTLASKKTDAQIAEFKRLDKQEYFHCPLCERMFYMANRYIESHRDHCKGSPVKTVSKKTWLPPEIKFTPD